MCCYSSHLNPDWGLLSGLWAPLSSAAARGAAVRSHLLTHLLQELCCRRRCCSCTPCFCQSHLKHTHCPAGCWHHPRSSASFTHSLFPQMIHLWLRWATDCRKTPKTLWTRVSESLRKNRADSVSGKVSCRGICPASCSSWTQLLQNLMSKGSTRLKTWCSWCSRCLKGALQPDWRGFTCCWSFSKEKQLCSFLLKNSQLKLSQAISIKIKLVCFFFKIFAGMSLNTI